MIPQRQSLGGLGNLMFKQAYLIGQMLDGNIPDLYVQSEKYWKGYEKVIKGMFEEGIGHTDKVALQIRRGDYLNTNFYVDLCKTNYYQEAISNFPSEKFLIFCQDRQDEQRDIDDKEWCKKFLDEIIPGRYEIWPGINETEDLNKMASCKGKIIANSSFGWWAGYLGEGKVVAPKRWFTDGVQRIDLPEQFTQI